MRGIRIIHEDPDVIVLEKAAGILSCATRGGTGYTVEDALSDYVRKGQARSRRRVFLVQRLDRETSGVMMVAKTPQVQEYFRADWNRLTEKTYLARVHGRMDSREGEFESYLAENPKTLSVSSVEDPAKGKLARTHYTVLSEDGGTSLVEVRLKSGRKNQIRVHFAEAGHPVLGDLRYGHEKGPLRLHSWRLGFVHPHTKEWMEFETPLPMFARSNNYSTTNHQSTPMKGTKNEREDMPSRVPGRPVSDRRRRDRARGD